MSFIGKNCQVFEEGKVIEVVQPHREWRIQVHGVYWFARTNKQLDFQPGDVVRIIGRQGLKLIVDKGEA